MKNLLPPPRPVPLRAFAASRNTSSLGTRRSDPAKIKLPRPPRLRVTLPLCALLALSTFTQLLHTPAQAADPTPPSTVVIVPYDSHKPLAGQKPDQLYVPYQQFLNLWQAAKEHRRHDLLPAAPEPAPLPFALTAARYDGSVEDRAIKFTARIDLTTGGDSWQHVPLPFRDAHLTALSLDGKPAALDKDALLVETAGRHRIDAVVEVPRPSGALDLHWGIPRTAAAIVVLRLPQASMTASISPGSGSVERTLNGAKEVTAAIGSSDTVRLVLGTSTPASRVAAAASAIVRESCRVLPGLEETDARVTFAFPESRQDRFTISFDAGLDLSLLAAPNLQTWKLRQEGARQILELALAAPAEQNLEVQLQLRRQLGAFPVDGKAPEILGAAKHAEVTALALFAGQNVDVTAKPSGLRQIPLDLPEPSGARAVAEFAGAGALDWHAALSSPKWDATVAYLFQVNRRQIELFASFQLFSNGDALYALAMDVPPGFTVQTVQSERLQDWWRDGDHLQIRFKDATPAMTPLVLYLVREEPKIPESLVVKPIVLQGFRKITGDAVITAHKALDVTMQLTGAAKEALPDKVAADYQVLPPLERKRGISFTEQAFSAQVSLAAAPARLAVTWAMDATAHEAWTSLSIKARADLRQRSIERIRFTLPAPAPGSPLPEARVSGADIRETRSHIEDGLRVYDVEFQRDVYDSTEFTIELDAPNTGKITLPKVGFPGAPNISGYVLVDNGSDGEMAVQSNGADPAPKSEIPWLPDLSLSAKLFRVSGDWSVTVAIERLEKAAGRAAFCAWADLTTAIRKDGEEWHKAVWHMQNRSLQFLPVHMPAGSELMSVRVDGQPVRADAGAVGGAEAVLIPLIKTKPGELSYDVELVYRVVEKGSRWRIARHFSDPELIGITVERTFWNVWVPDGWRLASQSGNMEPVIEEVAVADKLDESVQELKKLAVVANGTTHSEADRHRAIDNYKKLEAQVEAENAAFNDESTQRQEMAQATPSASKGLAAQQSAYVEGKQKTLAKDLGQLKNAVTQYGELPQAGTGGEARQPAPSTPADALSYQAHAPNQSANWQANAANPKAQTASTGANVSSQKENGRNIYLNDNVVLQQQAPKLPDSAPEKPAAREKLETVQTERQLAELLKDAKFGGAARSRRDSAADESKGDKQDDQALVLRTARGNTAFNAPAAEPPPGAKLASPATQADSPVAAGVSGGGLAASPKAIDALLAGANGFAFPSGALAAPNAAPDQEESPRPELKPSGRISLTIDFPTEGTAFHFKKVKGNANLNIAITRQGAFDRLVRILCFATIAAALYALQRHLVKPANAA